MSLTYLSSAEYRARAILDAYGSRPEHWPDDEREATLECIAHSAELQQHQSALAELDRRIESAQAHAMPAPAEIRALQQRILASLPAHAANPATAPRLSAWQLLRNWLVTPRFAIALSAFAVLVMLLGIPRTHAPVVPPQAAGQFEAWSWYDITGQDLPDASAPATLTMTDLIDLELNEDGG